MTTDKFLLHKEFSTPLNKRAFFDAKKKYLNLISQNNYSIESTTDISALIQSIKRSPEEIGTYRKISVFEALNRIGSDLVLLSGAEQLFKGIIQNIVPEKVLLRMGNTRGFDFEVVTKNNEVIYGEAFNAASSFCKEKMRQAINKLIDENPDKEAKRAIIFVNSEVQSIIEGYITRNHKLKQNKDFIKVIYCNT